MSCWASVDMKKECALLQLGWGGGCNNLNERLLLFKKIKSKKSRPENLETDDCYLRFSRPMSSSPISHHSLDLYLIGARWLLWFLGRGSVWRREERRLVSGKPKLTRGLLVGLWDSLARTCQWRSSGNPATPTCIPPTRQGSALLPRCVTTHVSF